MSCKGCKEKDLRCATNYAPCIMYEETLPEWSSLKGEQCVNIEETTKELYEEVGKLRDEVILELEDCDVLKFPRDVKGKTKVKEALPLMVEAICNISGEPQKILLDELNECLDWKGLKKEDNCGNEIKPQGICEIIQRLIDEIDALK